MYSYTIDDHEIKSRDEINDEIKQLVETEYTGVERQYLLQCAVWQSDIYSREKWVAYSPIYNRYTGSTWPLYSFNLEYADEDDIEFHSWKGDYEPQSKIDTYGTLPFEGKRKHFKGTVWTRG